MLLGTLRPSALATRAPKLHNAPMNSLPRVRLIFIVLAAALAGPTGCKRSGGAPGVAGPKPVAQGTLLATVTVAPLDRIVANVDALSRTLGLPFAGKDLLTTLAAQNG